MTGRRNRGIELALTLAALCVLLPALTLVYFAHRQSDTPPNSLSINEATPEQLARSLGVDSAIANRLVAARDRLRGFSSVGSLSEVRLFDRAEAERLSGQLKAAYLDSRTADAHQLAVALKLPPAVAARITQFRDESVGTSLPHPAITAYDVARSTSDPLLTHATLLDPRIVHAATPRLLVRRPNTVLWHFALASLLLALTLFLLPALLRNRMHVGGDPFLVPLSLLLSGLGVVMLFSIKDPLRDEAAYEHHLVGIALSVVAMMLCARLAAPSRQRLKRYQYLWVIGAVLLVMLLTIFGRGPEGVKLDLFGFQPVELIKLMLIFFLAGYLSDRADLIADTSPRAALRRKTQGATPALPDQDQGADAKPASRSEERSEERSEGRANARFAARVGGMLPRRQDLGPVVVLFMLSLMLFYVVKDLGPGLLMFASFIALLYLTTGRSSFVLVGGVLMIAGGLLGYWRHIGVFPTRVDMWLSPYANRHPNGMQLGQAYWALASGGWSGSGLGLGMPALIPRGQDDLAFISWTEETGLPGAGIVLIIYTALIWRGVRIALRTDNDFDRALAFGLTALLSLQTLLILMGVTGLTPLTGISLPFLCYGDSAMLAAFVIVGLLRSISASSPEGVMRSDVRPEVIRAGNRFAFALTFLLIGVIGLYRLGQIQVWDADRIALRTVVTPDADGVSRPHINPRLLAVAAGIERGSIYDRNGRILATSRPKELTQLATNPDLAKRLIGVHTRYYPYGPALAQLIGYSDPAVGGPYGLELAYNPDLRGYAHLQDLLSDYRRLHSIGYVPRRGKDLHLTLDAELQRQAQAILLQTASRFKDSHTGRPKDRGAFVLMDPHTGDVIVAASTPTFDPNKLTPKRYQQMLAEATKEQEYPLLDRAIGSYYPPGSTLKVATAACALDNMPDAMKFAVDCNHEGKMRWHVGDHSYARTIHDDKGDPDFGRLTLAAAFRVSSNIYFATLATAIGVETLQSTLAEKMGFRHTPTPSAFEADLADIGYGQGRMLASPLEMARLAACVANDGVMMQERVVTGIVDPAGSETKRVYSPVVRSQAMTPQTAAILRDLMRSVVTGGTAHGVFDEISMPVAGKTGTAQNRQHDRQPHSWFIGFVPAADTAHPGSPPRYAFACLVENGGYGRQVAAVVCRNVLKKLF